MIDNNTITQISNLIKKLEDDNLAARKIFGGITHLQDQLEKLEGSEVIEVQITVSKQEMNRTYEHVLSFNEEQICGAAAMAIVHAGKCVIDNETETLQQFLKEKQ